MERSVNFRDRQEEQSADLNNIQAFVAEAMQHLVMDAITGERQFTGLAVTQHSATELAVAIGRLWDGVTGKIYGHNEAEVVSLYSYLPVQDKKYLTVSIIGQEVDTDIQPRDYLVDLQTSQTEPRAVAMEHALQVVLQITAGLESTQPQKPEPPTGYTTIAQVLLDTSGIVSITLAENKKLARLFEVYQTGVEHGNWIALMTPRISTLFTDLATLASRIGAAADLSLVRTLAADLALVKQKLLLPATYAAYDADDFFDASKSDVAADGYRARVDQGLRFPWGGEVEKQLALFNPYDAAIKNFDGFILPVHTEATRLRTSGLAGTMSLSQYQFQTVQLKQMTRTRVRTKFSPVEINSVTGAYTYKAERIVEEVFEGTVDVDASGTIVDGTYTKENGQAVDMYTYYTRESWTEPYWAYETESKSVNGVIAAQTIMNSQNGWLLKVGLTFASKAADGVVNMVLCETENGLPNLDRAIGFATVDPAAIKVDGSETLFAFPQPVFLAAGKRLAIVLITGGQHAVNLVDGTSYTNGTLFYSVDGVYFQGDNTKDLMMSLVYAQFTNPRAVVELDSISLENGLCAFDILAPATEVSPAAITYEFQPSGAGTWYPFSAENASRLLGLPALCKMRAVMTGTTDLMPGLGLSGSRIRATRPALTFKHVSKERTLSAASSNIEVTLVLLGFDAAKHQCAVSLLSGGNTYAGTVKDEIESDGTIRRVVSFTPPAITAYKIQIDGTTSTALDCFCVSQRMDVAL